MAQQETHEPAASEQLFEDIAAGVAAIPDYRKTYSIFNQVFRKCIDLKTNAVGIVFSSTFVKTDYLLKELQVPRRLARDVHDTRNRLRKRFELSAKELQDNCYYDLETLCRFVAFVFQQPVPPALAARFPQEKRTVRHRSLLKECMRVVVERWDEKYVYVSADDGDAAVLTVCYVDANPSNGYHQGDWSYLKDLFYRYAQLNLVRPRTDDGIVYPELIIFEPDYLVDISAIARCFTNYAESPLVNLIKRIEPSQPTEATVLGNFASQLLDEAIHQPEQPRPYKESATEFFRNHAISLLSANTGAQFHEEAQRQRQHIWQAVRVDLPSALKRFDPAEGIVEPSFFSEMLGIQGRMDYLQSDFKVLLEQKSGKGEFPYDHFLRPRCRKEHYVQLLLYMLLIRYNYRERYEQNHDELHAFLLYSKYSESLDAHGFAPALVFDALRIRNGIAGVDVALTKPDGYKLLETLTPDMLNERGVSDSLWLNYQRPQIEALLSPIHEATELERAYYFRFLTFIANEHMLSKMGNKTKPNAGFAAKWHDSLEEKLLAGNICDRLTLLSPDSTTEGAVSDVVLQFAEAPEDGMSNFRIGDIVVLYPYEPGQEPDVRTTMVLRCTISDITADRMVLRLRAPQTDNRLFVRLEGKLWAVEHDLTEASFSPLYKGMHAFLSAPRERRDLLLLQRAPQTDPSVTLKGDYGEMNDLALRVKRARDLFLIVGPPGTGKTSLGMLNTVREELLESSSTILLTAYTNRAVDEICCKLLDDHIDFIRIGSEVSCTPSCRHLLLSTIAAATATIGQLRAALLSARIVVGTVAALSAHLPLLQLKTFSLAVVDEASQILEPHLMPLLSAANGGVAAIRKVVMIGDHKQLPAVVQQDRATSTVGDPLLRAIHLDDCRHSLFERLLRQYGDDNDIAWQLTRQGRMHHDIALFPATAFYNSRLFEVPLSHQLAPLPRRGQGTDAVADLLATRRIAFIHPLPSGKRSDVPSVSTINYPEATIIAAIVAKIYAMEPAAFRAETTVGVIVPYRSQIAAVRQAINRYAIAPLTAITIDTVERFQGSQRQYIVYGFTVQNVWQLDFLTENVFTDADGTLVDRKLNVAMTRAREHLIMVGNATLLERNATYARLLHFVEKCNSLFRVTPDDFLAGRFQVPEYLPNGR